MKPQKSVEKHKEDDSLPYSVWTDPHGSVHYKNKKSKVVLSPEEAYRANQLDSLVEQNSNLARDYLLARASISTSLVEKRAWNMLYALLRFVEGQSHFPRYKEQMSLFDSLFQSKKSGTIAAVAEKNLPLALPVDKSTVKDLGQLISDQELKNRLRTRRMQEQAQRVLVRAKSLILRRGEKND
jgi:hypothetical protein